MDVKYELDLYPQKESLVKVTYLPFDFIVKDTNMDDLKIEDFN